MTEAVTGFAVWSLAGIFFICMGICSLFRKKATGFWANADVLPVTDVKSYNAAMAKLFLAFGAVFLLLGLPLLFGSGSAWILLSVAGVMAEVIAAMAAYTVVIEKKYRQSPEDPSSH